MLNAQLARRPRPGRVAGQPTVITGRLVESQVKAHQPRHPSVARLIHVAVAVGTIALVGFGVLWLVAGGR